MIKAYCETWLFLSFNICFSNFIILWFQDSGKIESSKEMLLVEAKDLLSGKFLKEHLLVIGFSLPQGNFQSIFGIIPDLRKLTIRTK